MWDGLDSSLIPACRLVLVAVMNLINGLLKQILKQRTKTA